MQVTYASESTPGRVNDDYAICGPDWAVVLDGATAPAGVDSGCIHDVPWLVRHVAASLSNGLSVSQSPLTDILAAAIEDTRNAHADKCDLTNPDSPSTTVSMVRVVGKNLEYLTLGDSPIVLWEPGRDTQVFIDDRTAHLPGGRPYTFELVRSLRNKPEGFWIASTVPEAAYKAIIGTVELHPESEIALFTDGVTRLIEFYDYTWDGLFAQLRAVTPKTLIASVRDIERERGTPYGKQHDDATAVHITRPID
jgi:hypothetical protein